MRSRRQRYLYFAFGWACFGIGALGAILPILPTTPFMLLALWGFAHSSRRFHDWLYNHRWFGARLRAFKRHRVVPLSVKLTAYVSMLASLAFTTFVADVHWAVPVATATLILVGIIYIARCPSSMPTEDSAG